MEAYCYNAASRIYNYYYTLAIKEFNHTVADRLAKIPADYVYNQLKNTYPNCFINERCCLEYCNDMLDDEYNNLSPEFKREIYNKSKNLQTTVSDYEINMFLKAKRRKFKNLFYNTVNQTKQQQENDLSTLLENVSLMSINVSVPLK